MSRCTRKKSPVACQPLEPLEDRSAPSSLVRSYDGTGNNEAHPDWGSAGVALLRKAPAAYADGINDPVVGSPARPSPRLISDVLVDTAGVNPPDERSLTAMIYGWGQFIDHDMDLTTGASPSQPFNIPVPKGDPQFDPGNTGTQVIPFNRSNSVAGTGTSTSNPRQQPNQITAFLDGSMVYGSNQTVADALRTFSGGRLKTSPGADGVLGTKDDMLPFNSTQYFTPAQIVALGMGNDAHIVPNDQLFAAGDIRANENVELTGLQTLFVREHNFWADKIHAAAPKLSDEVVYQTARAIVGAEIQVITYKEYLPALLGANPLASYTGYKPNVNPGIANEFSTAIFRLGHSQLGEDVEFLDNNGLPVHEEESLANAFFNPTLLNEVGDIGPNLKYLASDPSSKVDNKIVDPVRNFLFGPPGAGGFDLASLNIQRGRDHGLPDYNTLRAAYGLPKVTDFTQITSNVDVQNKLQMLYKNVNNIDAWVGALAEDHIPGTSTGALTRAALVDQFTRLRDGDRFFYQNIVPGGTALQILESTTLAKIIARNTDTTNLQQNVFVFKASVSGTVFNDANGSGSQNRGEGGLAGRTVILFNITDDPNNPVELARTKTDANGFYRFDNFDELLVGKYRVQEVVPAGWKGTTPTTVDFAVTRGDTRVTVNFGNKRVTTTGFSALAASAPSAPSAASVASAQPVFLAPDSSTTFAGVSAQPAVSHYDDVAVLLLTDSNPTKPPSNTSTGAELILAPVTVSSVHFWDDFTLS